MRDPRRLLTGFGERADDVQRVAGALGLQVDAADEPPVEQEGPYVVTELALGRWGVDLDAVVKIEEPLHSWPEKDQRVERAQQRGTAVTAGHGLAGAQVRRRIPTVDVHAFELAVGDKLAQARA